MAEVSKAVVTVIGYDRKGIIAKVSNVLYEAGINILEISQTVLSGYFAMMMVVDLSGSSLSFGQVGEELKQAGAELGMNVTIQRMDIFDAMHRI